MLHSLGPSSRGSVPNIDMAPGNRQPPKDWLPVRLLTANMGNLNLRYRLHYNNKLCDKGVENAIANSIRAIHPDIVHFQELLHPDQCKDWVEGDPNRMCYRFEEQKEKHQPRRLLGDDYSIACSARNNRRSGHPVSLECIALNRNVGSIEGCAVGSLCFGIGEQDATEPSCNEDFIIHSVIARIRGLRVKLINVHAESQNRKCRNASIRQIFEREYGLRGLSFEGYTIIAGDFNFDPFRDKDDFCNYWNRHVADNDSGMQFHYHSGSIERRPPYPTTHVIFQHRTVDHILSNFAMGVAKTLGESPGTSKLDGGLGMDHRALLFLGSCLIILMLLILAWVSATYLLPSLYETLIKRIGW